MGMKVIIVTEEPPPGALDCAPKEFTEKVEIGNALSLLAHALHRETPHDFNGPADLKWFGRKIMSLTLTQDVG